MLGRTVTILLMCLCATAAFAQDFTIFNRNVQVHGFVTQGIAFTDNNNWLTMKTSDGSLSYTDFGVNISSQITDKLHVGAQVYDRNLGNLGDWHPTLDWALADYRFTKWLGVRGGKIKTTIGLYNDTQDLDFLHPFVLLPQSIYSTDLRESTMAHVGGDVYGDIPFNEKSMLAYTFFVGNREDSRYGGYPYLLAPVGIHLTSYGGLQIGGDVRWYAPIDGLVVGGSYMNEDIKGDGTFEVAGIGQGSYHEESLSDWMYQYYGQYKVGKMELAAEYRRYWRDQSIFNGGFEIRTDTRGWYLSGAYEVSKYLQLGAYFSRFTLQSPDNFSGAVDAHINDIVATARIDLNRWAYIKVEGHFMDGYGAPGLYPSGFYTVDNPQGLVNDTNSILLKAGFKF